MAVPPINGLLVVEARAVRPLGTPALLVPMVLMDTAEPVGVVEVVVDTPASVHPLPPKPAPPEVNLTAPQPVQTPKITAAQGVAAISKMADLPILAEVAEEEVQIWLTLDTMEAAVYTEAVAEEAGAE